MGVLSAMAWLRQLRTSTSAGEPQIDEDLVACHATDSRSCLAEGRLSEPAHVKTHPGSKRKTDTRIPARVVLAYCL